MIRRLALICALIAFPAAVQSKYVSPPAPDAPVEEARKYFTEDPDAPMVAPKGFDVTIVEYLDYQCPACRATQGPLSELLAKDKKVRVIFRDWPIFGPASQKAARLAIASKFQGKYVEFHNALFALTRPLTDEKIEQAARKAGIDWEQLQKDLETNQKDIEDLLDRNEMQANMLGLDGTPGFIIGNTQFYGAMTLRELEEAVGEARGTGGKSSAE